MQVFQKLERIMKISYLEAKLNVLLIYQCNAYILYFLKPNYAYSMQRTKFQQSYNIFGNITPKFLYLSCQNVVCSLKPTMPQPIKYTGHGTERRLRFKVVRNLLDPCH